MWLYVQPVVQLHVPPVQYVNEWRYRQKYTAKRAHHNLSDDRTGRRKLVKSEMNMVQTEYDYGIVTSGEADNSRSSKLTAGDGGG